MSVTSTAQTILDQTGYAVYSAGPPVTGDFTLINTEYMMDDAIDTVNLMFTQNIAALTGTAGSKTATMTRDQNSVVKMLLVLMLREAKKTSLSNSSSTGGSSSTGKSVSVNGISMSQNSSVSSAISASSALNNPANSVYVAMFNEAGKKLEEKTSVANNRLPPIYIGCDTS
jgi:hypothetical protein